jgi:small-conductance mechanosensitive channel
MLLFAFLQAGPPDALETVVTTLRGMLAGFLEHVPYLVIGLIVLIVFWAAGRIAMRLLHQAGARTSLHQNLADLLGRLVSAGAVVLGLLVAAVVVFPTFKPGDLIAGLGITSVAVGFAFKDILQNFFAGILLLWREPFKVGDEIRSGEFEGVVEDITIRSTRLRTYDGERAVLPNGEVFTHPILVRTAYEKRRVRFTVGVGYQDDLEKARATIESALATVEGVLHNPGPWIYVSELAPSSVNFNVYFWAQSPQANVLKVSDRVATAIKLGLDAVNIDIPYPHTVVLLRDYTNGDDLAAGGRKP